MVMLMLPLTSIVICTHNMGSVVNSAIRSALSQDSDSFEILILDDGSEDDTWMQLEQFQRKSNVRLFRNFRSKGLSAGRNKLLHEARGEFISILDADDLRAITRFGVEALIQHYDGGIVIKDKGSPIVLSRVICDILDKAKTDSVVKTILQLMRQHRDSTSWSDCIDSLTSLLDSQPHHEEE